MNPSRSLLLACLALSGLLSGCRVASTLPGPVVETVVQVEQPDLTRLPDGRVLAAWALVNARGTADIVLGEHDPSAGTWTILGRMNPQPGTAVAGRQVGPRIASGRDGLLIVSWIDRHLDPAGDVVVRVSHDHGQTFFPVTTVHDDGGGEVGQEYHDLEITPDGSVHLVWLDERDSPEEASNQKQVYHVSSTDRGRSFGPDRRLTESLEGVCPCCRPSLAAGADGRLHLIYRDRDEDTLFIRLQTLDPGQDTFASAVTLSPGWKYPGCPVNSPAVIAGESGQVWTFWWESDGLWWSFSADGGREFTRPDPLYRGGEDSGEGFLTQLNLGLAPAGGAFATWENSMGQVFFQALPAGSTPVSSPRQLALPGGAISRGHVTLSTRNSLGLCFARDGFAPADGAQGLPAPGLRRIDWKGGETGSSVLRVPLLSRPLGEA